MTSDFDLAQQTVWLRPAVKFNDDDYYEYVLMYVDNILAISVDGDEYAEFVLMYVDDILAILMDATAILKSMEGDTVKYKNDKD